MKNLKIKIYGQVQGIGFRWSAKKLASKLGVNGFVRNEADGSVLIEAEGNENAMKDFVQWSKKGPWFSKVERVELAEGQLKNYNNFEIQH